MNYRHLYFYLPKELAQGISFWQTHGYKMDWKNPKSFDEKIHWLLAKKYGKEEAFYADKYAVRKYVEECGYSYMLPKIYGTWGNIEEIKIDELPNSFILKTNHASGGGYYVICKDKNAMNWDEELRKIDTAMHTDFAKHFCEYHYQYIDRLIYAEELLNDGKENRMIDYKIHCFSGEPFCVMVCSGRDMDLKCDFFDLNWKKLNYTTEGHSSVKKIEKPESLERMVEAAAVLSKPFPFARIDFYDVYGKTYFGEITLSPCAGNLYYLNEEGQKEFGKRLILPCYE